MPKAHNPRRGSMQFWPRKRSRHSLARVRSWVSGNKAKPLGFMCFKAGMTHVLAKDNRPKSITKGEKVSLPVTIIECPSMTVAGVAFYKNSLFGIKKLTSIFAEKLNKDLAKKINLPKKNGKKIDDITEFDNLRLLIHSNPKKSSSGTKKPKLLEIAIGGSNEEKLVYAKEMLGKEITISQVFEQGDLIDVHAVTKGKGFQGTVKRYGVPIRQHKSEKTKRGIGNLGAWTPKRVDYRVPQPGKMGNHLRTEYNKQILQIGEDGKAVTPKGGVNRYGVIKNNYLLVHGSIAGPKKATILLTAAIRSNKKRIKEAYQIASISQ